MQIEDFISLDLHSHLVWLGKIPSWNQLIPRGQRDSFIESRQSEGVDVLGNTQGVNPDDSLYIVNNHLIQSAPGYEDHKPIIQYFNRAAEAKNTRAVIVVDMYTEFFARGPKYFIPTLEQWESMEQVKCSVGMKDFSSPYPAVSVRIPQDARNGLADRFKLKREQMARQALVYWRKRPGEPVALTIHVGQRYGTEAFFTYIDTGDDKMTLEKLLVDQVDKKRANAKRYDDMDAYGATWENAPLDASRSSEGDFRSESLDYNPGLWTASEIIARAALNLCLMLTQFGHKLFDPNDPARAKSRRERRELEARKTRDFATIEMRQSIIVRQPASPTENPIGPGTGIQVRPHWRKGHWCAYPGQAKLRVEGKVPQLYFKRPCLVRRDRATGDISESLVTYQG